MIKPIVKDSKVIFGPCRLSFPHLFEKHVYKGDTEKAKYDTDILIPKEEKETIKTIQAAIQHAKEEAVASLWSGKEPKGLTLPLLDGDDKAADGDYSEYENHFYLGAKSTTRPGIVDKHKTPIVDEEEMYGGVWAILSVTFWGYNNGKKGITCILNNVMKFKDDEQFGGGRASAESDFEGIDAVDDDDYL